MVEGHDGNGDGDGGGQRMAKGHNTTARQDCGHDEHKLITVTSDTNILQAIQLMTENHIRHVPVIDGKIVGMISIVDVVRAMVEQQSGEVNKLNEFIKGEYYC
ncbi:CBS domain-containing protein CBSX3, mitochondrial-like isoform X2 [Camellia sinensis]|uniref:CBS domain-containing protein CBSX3, mitochondrial-like isoform X2 n=1 Tax=Camellia sinensis TaxID=4442 RepID=UPI001036EF54|nr:CBS domain-containing protein CBSX3, mitochondrial-like isoform X2 [Camellia sinensis]